MCERVPKVFVAVRPDTTAEKYVVTISEEPSCISSKVVLGDIIGFDHNFYEFDFMSVTSASLVIDELMIFANVDPGDMNRVTLGGDNITIEQFIEYCDERGVEHA